MALSNRTSINLGFCLPTVRFRLILGHQRIIFFIFRVSLWRISRFCHIVYFLYSWWHHFASTPLRYRYAVGQRLRHSDFRSITLFRRNQNHFLSLRLQGVLLPRSNIIAILWVDLTRIYPLFFRLCEKVYLGILCNFLRLLGFTLRYTKNLDAFDFRLKVCRKA